MNFVAFEGINTIDNLYAAANPNIKNVAEKLQISEISFTKEEDKVRFERITFMEPFMAPMYIKEDEAKTKENKKEVVDHL